MQAGGRPIAAAPASLLVAAAGHGWSPTAGRRRLVADGWSPTAGRRRLVADGWSPTAGRRRLVADAWSPPPPCPARRLRPAHPQTVARRFVLPPRAPGARLRADAGLRRRPRPPAARRAATAGNGATLVVAGAGTGKTRTLTYRVAYLVETGVPPEQIALLTFTAPRRARDADPGGRFVGRTVRARPRWHLPRVLPGDPARPRRARSVSRAGSASWTQADAADVVDLARTRLGMDRLPKRFPKKRTLLGSLLSAVTNRGVAAGGPAGRQATRTTPSTSTPSPGSRPPTPRPSARRA